MAEPNDQNADGDDDGGVDVQTAELPEASESAAAPAGKIDLILETVMPIVVTFGQAEISVRDMLALGTGSVLKLDKQVGQPMDILLRGNKFAEGDLVIVGDQLGVRIKEITSPDTSEGQSEESAEGA